MYRPVEPLMTTTSVMCKRFNIKSNFGVHCCAHIKDKDDDGVMKFLQSKKYSPILTIKRMDHWIIGNYTCVTTATLFVL